jgi:dynein heavy chain
LQRGPDARLKKQETAEVINIFLMAAAWGFGALLSSSESKHELSGLLTQLASEQQEIAELVADGYPLPSPDMSLHDHYLDQATGTWLKWSDKLTSGATDAVGAQASEKHPSNAGKCAPFADAVLIPTEDTLRFTFLIDQLTKRSMPVCLLGGTGSGKTSVVKEYLANLKQEEWEIGQLVLSATTAAGSVQGFLESKLEKQRKGVFGPRVQGRRLLIFLDDMGMPTREKYGAQPPLELIRTLMSDSSIYDLKDTSLKKVVSTVIMAAMGLPGGGRALPTNRLLRHFCLISFPELSSQTMLHVFSSVLIHGLRGHNPIWQKEASTITKLSVALYQRVRKALLPTPAKCHY